MIDLSNAIIGPPVKLPPGFRAKGRTRPTPGKKSKYRAVPTVADGIRFASKKEAKRYGELKLMEKAGELFRLELQKVFYLHASSARFGPMLIGKYVADFVYWRNGEHIIEDVKGFKTPLYRWKKRHVEAQYGVKIVEI